MVLPLEFLKGENYQMLIIVLYELISCTGQQLISSKRKNVEELFCGFSNIFIKVIIKYLHLATSDLNAQLCDRQEKVSHRNSRSRCKRHTRIGNF